MEKVMTRDGTHRNADIAATATRMPRTTAHNLGLPFTLLLAYLVMEYARPANPMGIPIVISIALFLSWATLREKDWCPQVICYCLLLGVIAAMGPFAVNSFSIWNGFRGMAVQLVCICIPLIHFVNSMRKVEMFINMLVSLHVYLALFGILHGGIGPGGHVGDENDLSLALNMIIPFAFVSALIANDSRGKALFGSALGLLVAGVVASYSRGGFLGLVTVFLYCFLLTPHKRLAVVTAVLLAFGILIATPAAYWAEMATISSDAMAEEGGTGALRREYWAIAWSMFTHNPMLGVGINNFTWNVSEHQTHEQLQRMGRSFSGQVAHSLYFTVLAELGVIGTVIVGVLVWYTFKEMKWVVNAVNECEKASGARPGRRHTTQGSNLPDDLKRARCYAHGIRAGLIAYLVCGTFLTVLSYPHFWVITALAAAVKRTTASRLEGDARTGVERRLAGC